MAEKAHRQREELFQNSFLTPPPYVASVFASEDRDRRFAWRLIYVRITSNRLVRK